MDIVLIKNMPAQSHRQQISACLALAAKEGKVPVNRLQGASLEMYKSMSVSQLRDFCKGKIKKK